VVYPRCCGRAIHKKPVAACLITPGGDGVPRKEIRSSGTMTDDRPAPGEWPAAAGCTHVAMEGTSMYRQPISTLPEGSFRLLPVDAPHIKAAPGRKTDVRAREWIADPVAPRAAPGQLRPRPRFPVARQPAHIDDLDGAIPELSAEGAERLRPSADELARPDEITGVGRRTAEVIVAARGTDMARLPTDRRAASRAGLCPGNRESAGQRRSGEPREGNRYPRAALTEAAQAAGRTTDSDLGAQYRRLAARRGKKQAAGAVGQGIPAIAYHLLKHAIPYHDLGGDYFDRRARKTLERHLVRRLAAPGHKVTREPAVA
jgi:hypothetical protein